MKKVTTKKMTTLALLTAMSVVVCLLIRFPLVPAASFMHFDPKDVVIAIAGFIYGPMSAVIVSVASSLIENMFTGGTWIDVLMNIVSTLSYVLPASFLYKKLHTKQGALIGLLAGMACMTGVMLLWNYVFTPIYYGMPRSAVASMMPAILLFNVLKSGLNTGITLIVYKPVVTALRRSGLVEESQAISNAKALSWVGVFVVLSAVIVIFAIEGII